MMLRPLELFSPVYDVAMCGRYAFYSPAEAVKRIFRLEAVPELEARYNVAPTQDVPVVRAGAEGGREFGVLHWALVPFWAKEKAIGNRMINARVETVAEKPAYRDAFKRRHCLILTDGWYEWMVAPGGKQPYFIRRKDARPFAFAGLWERWKNPADETPLESCTIVTTDAADSIKDIHPRMPLALPDAAWDVWLDPAQSDAAKLPELLHGAKAEEFQAWPVSRQVNAPKNQGPELLERI
jgi:putative SOS response-associated peptidase YedK